MRDLGLVVTVVGVWLLFAYRAAASNKIAKLRLRPIGTPPAFRPQVMRISREVIERLKVVIGQETAEKGGMLGGSRGDFIAKHFVFDQSARRSSAQYSPDCTFLNDVLRKDWDPRKVFLLGFVHSHPAGMRTPSAGDLEYAKEILKNMPNLPYLLLPIVMTEPDSGRFEVIPFAAVRGIRKSVRIVRLSLEVIDDDASYSIVQEGIRNESKKTTVLWEPVVRLNSGSTSTSLTKMFDRVQTAYDLSQTAGSRLVSVGTGGAAQYLEELARSGVGEFVLIDPDVVSETNLATQQVYRRDIGRPKVECIAERIRDINPQAFVLPIQKRLEEIDDREFERLALEPLQTWKATGSMKYGMPDVKVAASVSLIPSVTLLGGFTDNFEAQARVNRLALHFGLPSICAQVYAEGRGAEVTFTYPGVTPACHRCALSSRYKAYLKEGFKNDVTSSGTPIFATTRLNALKGHLSMALLHHGKSHSRWGNLLQRVGCRNLVQIRMDPDLSIGGFAKAFAGADRERLLCDETIWLPQKPDSPANGFPICPDCGGTGDLRNVRGTFDDTRLMRS